MRVGSKAKDHKRRGAVGHSKHAASNPIRYGKGKGFGRNGNPPRGGSPALRGTRALQRAADQRGTSEIW